jgi:hypothetical protein
MKFHYHSYKNQWAIYPIPFAFIYFESCEPESHLPLLKHRICGIYLSLNWLRNSVTIGFCKRIK